MPPETYITSSRSLGSGIALALGLIIAAGGGFAAPHAFLGIVVCAVGVFASLFCLLGFIWPTETGMSVDDIEIRWWTTQWPRKSAAVLLEDIVAVERVNLDSSWIDIKTKDGKTYSIPDFYTGGTDGMFLEIERRLAILERKLSAHRVG